MVYNQRKYPHVYCCGAELELQLSVDPNIFMAKCFVCKKEWMVVDLTGQKELEKKNLKEQGRIAAEKEKKEAEADQSKIETKKINMAEDGMGPWIDFGYDDP